MVDKWRRPEEPVRLGAALAAGSQLLSTNVEATTREFDDGSVGFLDPTSIARIEAEVLLMACLGIDRVQLYCRLDSEMSPETMSEYLLLVNRRLTGEPVPYIIGKREFYGLDFFVDRGVLIPRPETELIVEAVLRRFGAGSGRGLKIVDVGTGSGAIAISLAVNLPEARIAAVDRSFAALEVARKNVARHNVEDRVELVQGDLLEPIEGAIDVVVANLPYIPHDRLRALPRDVREFEPLGALDGGADGLDPYRRLLALARQCLNRPGWLLLEIDPEQVTPLLRLARQHFPASQAAIIKDYAGLDRIVCVDA